MKNIEIEIYKKNYYDFQIYLNPNVEKIIKSLPNINNSTIIEPIFECLDIFDLIEDNVGEFIVDYLSCSLI